MHEHDDKRPGWLFRLNTTLGKRQAVPAWPASPPAREEGAPRDAERVATPPPPSRLR